VKLKGNKYGVTSVVWHGLKKGEKEDSFLATTRDKFKISRICNSCYRDSLKTNNIKGYSIVECKNCKTLRQRNANATKNALLIESLISNGHGRLSSKILIISVTVINSIFTQWEIMKNIVYYQLKKPFHFITLTLSKYKDILETDIWLRAESTK
jgi:hypothetical protein